ncbi:RING-type domain-containing protein [Entamoeba marina]
MTQRAKYNHNQVKQPSSPVAFKKGQQTENQKQNAWVSPTIESESPQSSSASSSKTDTLSTNSERAYTPTFPASSGKRQSFSLKPREGSRSKPVIKSFGSSGGARPRYDSSQSKAKNLERESTFSESNDEDGLDLGRVSFKALKHKDTEDGEFNTGVEKKSAHELELEDLFQPNWLSTSQFDFSSRGIKPKGIATADNVCLLIDTHNCYIFRDNDFIRIPNLYKESIETGIIDPTGTHILLLSAGNKLSYYRKDMSEPKHFTFSFPDDVVRASLNTPLAITALAFEQKVVKFSELSVYVGTNTGCIFRLVIYIKKNPIQASAFAVYPFTPTEEVYDKSPRMGHTRERSDKLEPPDLHMDFTNKGVITGIFWYMGAINNIIIACTATSIFKVVIETKGSNKTAYINDLTSPLTKKVIPDGKGQLIVQKDRSLVETVEYKVLWQSAPYEIAPNERRSTLFRASFSLTSDENDGEKMVEVDGNTEVIDALGMIETSQQIFSLRSDRLESYDFRLHKKCHKLIEGRSISISLDQNQEHDEYIWVCTEYCLYKTKTIKPDYTEAFDIQLILNMPNTDVLLNVILRALDTVIADVKNSSSRLRVATLYVWAIVLVLNARDSRLKDDEAVRAKLLYLLKKQFYGKELIDNEIIRYLVRNTGDAQLFGWYCQNNQDFVGFFSYCMDNALYTKAIGILGKLYTSDSIADRMTCVELTKKNFALLFREVPFDFIEFMTDKDMFSDPIFYTTLSLLGSVVEESVFNNFIFPLLNYRVSCGRETEQLMEILFWREISGVGRDAKDDMARDKDSYIASMLFKRCGNIVSSHHIIKELKHRKYYKSLLYIYEHLGKLDEAIEVSALIIKRSGKEAYQVIDDVNKLFSLVNLEKNIPNRETLSIKALSCYIDAFGSNKIDTQSVVETIKHHNIPIECVLAVLPRLLPSFKKWKFGDMKQLISDAFNSYSLEENKYVMETKVEVQQLDSNIKSLNYASDVCKEPAHQYVSFNVTKKCSFCSNRLCDGDQAVIFLCTHQFHLSCILKEYNENKTPFALRILEEYAETGDKSVLVKECPICSVHTTQMIDISFCDVDDSWNI